MLIIPPVKYRRRSGRAKSAARLVPMLISAVYDWDNLLLTLVFDRAVDIAAIDPELFVINDNVHVHSLLAGDPDGASKLHPQTVQLAMLTAGSSTPGPVTMSAGAGNGITARTGGAAWPGVMGLALPWP